MTTSELYCTLLGEWAENDPRRCGLVVRHNGSSIYRIELGLEASDTLNQKKIEIIHNSDPSPEIAHLIFGAVINALESHSLSWVGERTENFHLFKFSAWSSLLVEAVSSGQHQDRAIAALATLVKALKSRKAIGGAA